MRHFILTAVLLAALINTAWANDAGGPDMSYPAFIADVEAKAVRTVIADGGVMRVTYADGHQAIVRAGTQEMGPVIERLLANGVTVMVRPAPGASSPAGDALLTWFPVLLYVVLPGTILAAVLWNRRRHRRVS